MVSKTADPAREDNEVRVADETTPLLNAAEPPAVPSSQEDNPPSYQGNGHPVSKASLPDQNNVSCPESTAEDEDKPMPYLQIILLCYASLAEPVAYFAIFPFINEMIHLKGHVAEKNVGFWSGMIESLFSLVQMVLMIFYGRAADRLGRKPVLVFSLTGVSIATAFFGMGQNLPQMVLLRCLAGCFAGSVVTIRTMISENCTKSTQARAFSWYMFVRNVGILIGPLIGEYFNISYISSCPRDVSELTSSRWLLRQPGRAISSCLQGRPLLGEIPLCSAGVHCRRRGVLLGHHNPLLCQRNAQTEDRRHIQTRSHHVHPRSPQIPRRPDGALHPRPHNDISTHVHRSCASLHVHERQERRLRLLRSVDRDFPRH